MIRDTFFFSVYWHVVIDSVERMLTFCNMPQVEEMFHNWFSQLITLCSTVFLIHFAIDVWRSDINDLMIIPVPRRIVKAVWNARNSIPELLPAWLA